MARWAVALVVAIVAALCTVLAPAVATRAAPRVTTYTYDGHRRTRCPSTRTVEQGAPAAYGRFATYSRRRPVVAGRIDAHGRPTPPVAYGYNNPESLVQAVRAGDYD